MKKISFIALVIISIALTWTVFRKDALYGLVSSQQHDWNFIESVGGMKVDLVGHRLLASCDISGTRAVTKQPTTTNSMIGVRKLKCSRAGDTIRLTVVSSVISKNMTSECGSVDLSGYPPGSYSVVYLNPDGTTFPLGRVKLT